MKFRSKILLICSNFPKMVETQFSKRIKFFRSDNALEYTQYVFQALWHSYGIVHNLTCLGTSQQNGRAERKLHHIFDTVCAFLFSAKVPTSFSGEAAVQLLIAFQALSSVIKLHMSAFLGHPLTIISFAPSVLLVPFFFSLMSITNLSLDLDFVVSLTMA